MCQRFRRYTRYLRSLYHIVIQMIDLCLININVYTAQQINCICHCCKVYTDVFFNGQIQILIQHLACLLRTTCRICGVRFIELASGHIQISITEYRCQTNFSSIIIDTCNNNRIASVSFTKLTRLTGIQTKQCNRRIT